MKTVNLELSKQLKSTGFPQDTEHSSFCYYMNNGESALLQCPEGMWPFENKTFASPTADEILDQLPDRIVTDEGMCFDLNIWSNPSYPRWVVSYWWDEDTRRESGMDNKNISDNSLADALAKMWLYLKNNNLLKGV